MNPKDRTPDSWEEWAAEITKEPYDITKEPYDNGIATMSQDELLDLYLVADIEIKYKIEFEFIRRAA
jgi:hypothetical protein